MMKLAPCGFTVNVTASGYVASSKGISLTSNQTLAFPLTKVVASTFTVNGIVTDGTSGGILPGIRVSITSGTNAGKSSTTDSSGNYAFTGVSAGTMTISGSATSYTTVDKSVTVTGNTRLDFVLPRIAAAPAPSPSPAPGGLGTGAFLSLGTDSTTCRCWNSPITFKINGTSAATLSCSGSAKVAVAPPTREAVLQLIQTLAVGLQQIARENVYARDPSGEMTRKKLSLIWEAARVEQMMDLLGGAAVYRSPLASTPALVFPEGLKDLKELKQLTELCLDGTNVTDAGLKELKALNKLTSLYLLNARAGWSRPCSNTTRLTPTVCNIGRIT